MNKHQRESTNDITRLKYFIGNELTYNKSYLVFFFAMATPIGELLEKEPGLQTGPHMRYISDSLLELAVTDLRSARQMSAAIMQSSTVQNTNLLNAARGLADLVGDPSTDHLYRVEVDRYSNLPLRNTGSIPDNINLLNKNTALAAFIGTAISTCTDSKDINTVTDEIIQSSQEERNGYAKEALLGKKRGVKPHLLPLGLELD